MRAHIICFYIFLSLSNFCFTQDWLEDTCQLKGPVKSVSIETNWLKKNDVIEWEKDSVVYNRNGFMVYEQRSASFLDGWLTSCSRIFNNSGSKCITQYYIEEKDTTEIITFSYNKKNQISESLVIGLGHQYPPLKYVYNELGQKTKTFINDSNSPTQETTFKYDKNGRITEKVTSSTSDYYYWNKFGLLSKERHVDSRNSPSLSYIKEYRYNEFNQLVEIIKTNIEGEMLTHEQFQYDSSGEINIREFNDYLNEHYDKCFYSYTFDSFGNWTERKTHRSKKTFVIDSREIVYYQD